MPNAKDILIIDDDCRIVKALSVRLRSAGFVVHSALDGLSGLAEAIRGSPKAIVLDIRIPEMDGLTLLSKLKAMELTRKVPVIMLSANAFDRRSALERGARHFVSKPYDPAALLSVIESSVAENAADATRDSPDFKCSPNTPVLSFPLARTVRDSNPPPAA